MFRIYRLLMAFLAVTAALAAGCTQTSSQVISDLPIHELELNSPPPAAPIRQARPSGIRRPSGLLNNEWAASSRRPWRYIVIHHSATDFGSAASFDADHRKRGWDELGYHFVITNGNGGTNGKVEVGPRWRKQKWGAHCGGTPDNEYNNYGIGICLVGDFSGSMPSRAQMASLDKLVGYLTATYDIPPENIIGHSDAPASHTNCPGAVLESYITDKFRVRMAGRDTVAN